VPGQERRAKVLSKQVRERAATGEGVHDDVEASQATAPPPREDFEAFRLLCCERKWWISTIPNIGTEVKVA